MDRHAGTYFFRGLKIGGNHSRETAKQIACRHNPHSGYSKGAHGFRRRKQSQNLRREKDDGQRPQYHHAGDQSGSVSESGMQPSAVARAVVKPHDRQTALDQAVYRHNDQLLHLKICAEESDRRIGIRHQEQIDEGHHKRTEGVHNKRWQAQGKNTADHLLLQMKAFDLYPHLLLFAQQQSQRQNHGQQIARDRSHRSAAGFP